MASNKYVVVAGVNGQAVKLCDTGTTRRGRAKRYITNDMERTYAPYPVSVMTEADYERYKAPGGDPVPVSQETSG